MFGLMKYFGILRVSTGVEIAGMDQIKHGEPAYPISSYLEGEHPHNGTNLGGKFGLKK